MTKIRWAILGTSPISETLAHAIQESKISELAAIGSRDMARAQQFATKFSIPKAYDNYDELLADPNIDAVYIGLPNYLHKEWSIRAAKAKKHILCEKPFVVSVAEAEEVIAAVKENHVNCIEAVMYRYHPFTQKLQELIQSKIIGEVKSYQALYTANIVDVANPIEAGAIRNLGCYPISLVRLLADAEPLEVIGTGKVNANTGNDEFAMCGLTFPNGVKAVVSTADNVDMVFKFEVLGTKGRLQVISNPWLPEKEDNQVRILLDDSEASEITIKAPQSLYSYQIDYLNSLILNNAVEHAALIDSLNNTKTLEAWRALVLSRENTERNESESVRDSKP